MSARGVYNQSQTNMDVVLQFGQGKSYNYDKDATVAEMIENQVKKTPDRIAIKFQKTLITYRQLNEKANQLAHYLIKKGINPRSNIAVYLEPSLNLIISILAVLKVGGCYIPLDINYPIDRLNCMLEDCSAKLLLTQSSLVHKLNDTNINLIELDTYREAIRRENSDNLDNKITSNDSAYIIYTSGTTGAPKGIAIHHQAINNHMIWMQNHFKFNTADTILLKTPISFDPSVWEIFLPLYIGAQLVIAPAKSYLNPESLIKLIKRYHVTTIQFVPTLFHEFLKQDVESCVSLQRVFVGGESLKTETKKLFFDKLQCSLYNLYGPTEATIEITSHQITSSDLDINANIIGKPIYNTNLYVLNTELQLVDAGEEGELYIGGDSLSKGYYNKEELTNDKFINNPFDSSSNTKLYRTGDIVKWLESGDLVYIGRNNDQIKINGVRIEPNELVSHILINHPILDCLIVKRMDYNNHAFLACYLIPQENINPNIPAIHNSLKNFFPHFMLPKRYAIIDSLPITVNGKTDLAALPDPNIAPTITRQRSILNNINQEEKRLLAIWSMLLGNNEIELEDNFFEIGGNSILAFQLLMDIKNEFKVMFHIKDIFLYPTALGQIKRIFELKKTKENKKIKTALMNSLIPLQSKGNNSPLFLIHPIGGTVFWYSNLANLLGGSRPVYGIQDPAIELQQITFSNIAEMAESYISMIKTIQPHGPYFIGGASFGATVAVEIAKKLQEQNEKIAIVVILDGWAVYPNTLRDDNYFKNSMRRQHADIRYQFKKHNLPEPQDLFEMQWHRLSLLWDYQMDEIKFPIAVFKSKEILPAFEEIDAPLNHWEKFTKEPFKFYLVPGNHETMFQAPHVTHLAFSLKECLEEVENLQPIKKETVAKRRINRISKNRSIIRKII